MDAIALGRRFLESTRGQVVLLLRRGARTVEELAQALGLTDNAVRSHLAALERDGLVRQDGVRRGPGAGKPATIYELHPDADPLLSRAYPPVLKTMLDVMLEQLPRDRSEAMLHEVGRRLAAGVGGRAAGSSAARTEAAANVLRALGGDVEVVEEQGRLVIRSSGCPSLGRRLPLSRHVLGRGDAGVRGVGTGGALVLPAWRAATLLLHGGASLRRSGRTRIVAHSARRGRKRAPSACPIGADSITEPVKAMG